MAQFINFKEFKAAIGNLAELIDYLSVDLSSSLRNLKTGLTNLDFKNNFESFEVTVTIAAGATVTIPNQFRNNVIPTRRLIVKCTGSANIVDGDWTATQLKMTNAGASSATVTIIFLR
jgi:glutaredoxin-related protein